MTGFLLDANVLIAATVIEHEHHERATRWLATVDSFAVCPIAQGALVRFLLRIGESSRTATALLTAIEAHPRAHFVTESLSFADVDLTDVVGHRQATDVYLAALAAGAGKRLATFDRALATLRPTLTHLVPD